VIPGHVRTIEDYWVWIDRLLDESGGYVDGAALIVQPVEDEDGHLLGLAVPVQVIRFWDDTTMLIAFSVSAELQTLKFAYHYQTDGGQLIWRIDNVGNHLGGIPHIHRAKARSEVIDEWFETDLGDALEYKRTAPPDTPPIARSEGTFL
jgi:hypothetical protein